MVEKIISELGPWIWWIIGFALLALEIFVPTSFFLWIGLAALIVGANALFVPMSWAIQIALFAVLSIILAVIGRKYFSLYDQKPEQENLNARDRQHVGKVYELVEDVINGRGRVKVGDSLWSVEATEDLPSGTKVRVSDSNGTVLIVERV